MRDAFIEESAAAISLFDSLARLVPEGLKTEYYRVVAHAQTLSPDDEMLRILEAMGVLTLIIRQTPSDISEEREQIRDLLEHYLQTTRETQGCIVEFGKDIDNRLSGLPKEIELGLNPMRISALLGEALRQHLAATGMKETVASLEQTVTQMRTAQQYLVSALKDVGDPHYGVAAKVEEANRRIGQSVEARSARVDEFLDELRTDLLRVWFPIIACASLVLGFGAGISLQAWRDSSQESSIAAPTQAITTPSPPATPIEQLPAKSIHRRNR
jgi:hypothetical protein